jgi:hypothetical protein
MRYRWHPKPQAPKRTGALGFVFVVLLFVAIAVLIFRFNPLAPTSERVDLLPTAVGSPGPPRVSSLSVGKAVSVVAPGKYRYFLPLIDR